MSDEYTNNEIVDDEGQTMPASAQGFGEVTDEVEIVEENNETRSSFTPPDVKKLKEQLKECSKERQEYLEGWQRAKADVINAGKAHERTRGEVVKYAAENLIGELLPVVDSFEMAFADRQAWEQVDQNWRMGVEYIHAQLMKVMEGNGLATVDPQGEAFDPTHHESVDTVAVENAEQEGVIVEVVQKGYTLGGKSIRPPRVKVGVYETNNLQQTTNN